MPTTIKEFNYTLRYDQYKDLQRFVDGLGMEFRSDIPKVLFEMLNDFNNKIAININENYWLDILYKNLENLSNTEIYKFIELSSVDNIINTLTIGNKKYLYDNNLVNDRYQVLVFEEKLTNLGSVHGDYEEYETIEPLIILINIDMMRILIITKNSITEEEFKWPQ